MTSMFRTQPQQSRDDLRRAQRLRVAHTIEEINRSDLQFHRFDIVHHTRTGDNYKIIRGEIADAKFTPPSPTTTTPPKTWCSSNGIGDDLDSTREGRSDPDARAAEQPRMDSA